MKPKHLAAEHARSYYHERKRLGLCVKCGRKVEAGMSQCGVCRSGARRQWRNSRYKRPLQRLV